MFKMLSNKNLIRCFFAIELPDEVKRWILDEVIAPLSALPVRVRWVRADGIHITVRFLGEVSGDVVEYIVGRAGDVIRGISPIRLRLSAPGTFGGRVPRVVWIGVEGDLERLGELHDCIERLCRDAGLPPDDRRFSPHITIGRVKSPANTGRMMSKMKEIVIEPLEFIVNGVVLFRSTLTPQGAVYDPIDEFSL